jgi:hypothetical protein
VFYSGGIGSYTTAKRVIEKVGKENVILLFTDTKIEDEDLYRFLDDTSKQLDIPVTYVADGRTPWEVFKDVKFLGNSRIAQCSHILKQDAASKWIKANFKPDECTLYLGIDWTEEQRTASPKRNWSPYVVEFPMCEEPYVTKEEMLAELKNVNIEIPRLYKLGFAHNNCGGGCVRAGQGHFINLLKTMPDRFKEWEENEQKMRDYLGKDVSILRRQRNHVKEYITLRQLREEWESNNTEQIDLFDIGGCGCFVQDNE